MDAANALDIKAFIANAINKVFDTMPSFDVEVFDADSLETENGNRFRGSVDITGELTGSVELQISEVFARLITASLHGSEKGEIKSDEAVEDVIREMSNTIAGQLKADFHESGLSCELSIPSVTTGSDFEIETLGVTRDERLGFRHDQHAAIVEVRIQENGSVEADGQPSSDQEASVPAEVDVQAEEIDETLDQVLGNDSLEEEKPAADDAVSALAEDEARAGEIDETLDQILGDDSLEEEKPAADDAVSAPAGDEAQAEAGAEPIDQMPGDDSPEEKEPAADEELSALVEVDVQAVEDVETPDQMLGDDSAEEKEAAANEDDSTPAEVDVQAAETAETLDHTPEESLKEEPATGEDVSETETEVELPRIEAVGEGAEMHFRKGKWYEKAKVGLFLKQEEKIRLYAKRVLAVTVPLVCFLGLYLWNERKEIPEAQVRSSAPPIPLHPIKGARPKPASPIEEKLQDIAALRDELSMKKQDIAHLKRHYQKGIEELAHEIENEIRAKQIDSYQQAINDKKIELALRTIQRRKAYIQQLDQPYDRLNWSGEELLFIERLTKIENQLADLTTGINGVELMRRLDRSMRKHRLVADKLAFDMKGVNPQSLKTIWGNIIEGNKESETRKKELFQKENKNQEIWQEIFYGNFNRKNELTELSPEVAKYLSKWQGKDLSLNSITKLPPELAKELSHWQGDWLSLNGLLELAPGAANHLSQWQGKCLSLNGLPELAPDAAMYLSQWQGKQLELIGLKRLAQEQGKQSEEVALKYLAEWEKSGGRLFVSEDIRKMIHK